MSFTRKFKDIYLLKKSMAYDKKWIKKIRKPYKNNMNEDDCFFEVDELNYFEIDFLLHKNYKVSYQQNLFGEKQFYLLKPPLNESLEHFFLVQIIKKSLEDKFDYVKGYRTREADIIFKVRNRYIALEIETGRVLKKNKKRFIKKVKSLNEDYDNDWFFIVTNRDLVKKYKVYGKTLTRKNFLTSISEYVKIPLTNPQPNRHQKNRRRAQI